MCIIMLTLASNHSTPSPEAAVAKRLRAVLSETPSLPLPGCGDTLERWRAFARVAEVDLSLAKLYESHMDAMAIHAELGSTPPVRGSQWGVWASKGGSATLRLDDHGRLHGRKEWCSGAPFLSHALVTTTGFRGESVIVAVELDASTMRIGSDDWYALGMSDTYTRSVEFRGAKSWVIGTEEAYLERAGFWYGAAGIAACWYGGALALASTLRGSDRLAGDTHLATHLGAVDVWMTMTRDTLEKCARDIDRGPHAEARMVALRARGAVELAATEILRLSSRALGAAALCRNASFARHAADLPVFIRQSHGDRDLAVLGSGMAERSAAHWSL